MSEAIEEKLLSLYPIDYPFETLVSRISATPAKLKLDPDFQRKYKWDKDGWARSSKFIESCLMRIPLPSCYFAEDDDGKHMVIDGVQRLTTINRFFNDEFALEGLTTFKELEGKKFSEIGPLMTELETTTIRCIILRKDNPKKLIREIFSRLNQGAVELSDQEIRHAIYPGSLDALLSELAKNPSISRFGMADGNESERDGLEPEEQVLRFFAFASDLNLEKFTSNLKGFLDDYMESNSDLSEASISEYRDKFKNALRICENVFEKDVFVNPTVQRRRKGLIHYDLMMTTVGILQENIANEKAAAIRQAYTSLCESEEFKRTSAGGLQDKSRVVKRRNKWKEMLGAVLNA